MKKTFTLLAAVAMVTAPIFAEVTPSLDFELNTDINDLTEGFDSTADNSYGADGDEANYLSIDVGFDTDYTDVTVNVDAEVSDIADAQSDAPVLWIDDWYVQQDITGALGIDGPIAFSLKAGMTDFNATEYYSSYFNPFDEIDFQPKNSEIIYTGYFTVNDMFTVALATDIASLFNDTTATDTDDDEPTFGASIYGEFDFGNLAFSYVSNLNSEDADSVGAIQLDYTNSSLLDDALTIGFQLQGDTYVVGTTTDLESDFDLNIAAGAMYTMDAMTVTGSVSFLELLGANDVVDEDGDDLSAFFAHALLDVSYDVTDKFNADLCFERASEDEDGDVASEDIGGESNTVTLTGTYGLTDWMDASLGYSTGDLAADEDQALGSVDVALDFSVDSADYSLSVSYDLEKEVPSANIYMYYGF